MRAANYPVPQQIKKSFSDSSASSAFMIKKENEQETTQTGSPLTIAST
jgi:hypothetical protein